MSEYEFYKEHDTDKVWWVDNGKNIIGEYLFSFDKEDVFNLFADYPSKLTPEQKAIFDKENPFWVDFFTEEK